MKRRFRLTRSSEIQRVRRFGKSYAHPLLVLIAYPNARDELKIGVIAGGSVGGAVERNRAKRQMRAGIARLLPSMPAGWDLIFVARKPIVGATFAQISAAFASVLRRADLLGLEDGGL